ncbi:MAG: LysR family transcriptional regulator [Clostridia bacterium]
MTLQQLKYVIEIAKNGSISRASEQLFLSQPSLSASLKDLEKEIGFQIFTRNNKGLAITSDGKEFLTYAKQVILQYGLLEDRYIVKKTIKKRFAVSTQHYSFAVKSFINMVNAFNLDEYEFCIRETKTHEIIDDVRFNRSEIGVLYLNDFNRRVLGRVFEEYDLEFVDLLNCSIYVYMAKNNPLAKNSIIEMSQLEDFPCLSFEQENAFYYAEEVFSTYEYKRLIKANDRATMLNLMKGINGYTFCSGIISQELNGDEYVAIPLNSDEKMLIGYIKKSQTELSELAKSYINEINNLI